MNTTFTRRVAAPALVALGLAACGSDGNDSTAAQPDDTLAPADSMPMDSMPMDSMPMDSMDGMDGMQMNMGDPNATAAEDVEGAALARGEFTLMDSRPAGYDDVAGTTVIARSSAGTTVTTRLTGLLPNVDYISHLHEQACADDNAGDHFQFVDGDIEVPPNEIHLVFTSDNDGVGFMTAENDAVAGSDAVSFVVHPREFIDNKIACVDFVADDADAVAAAIAAGPAFDPAVLDGDMADMSHGADDADHSTDGAEHGDGEHGDGDHSGHDSDGEHSGHDSDG